MQSTLRRFARVALGCVFAAVTLLSIGCRHDGLAPYSEADELKVRTDEAKALADPRGDLAFLRNIEVTGNTVIGNADSKGVVLDHWQGQPLTVDRNDAATIAVSSGSETLLDGKAITAGQALPDAGKSWITNSSLSLKLMKNGDRVRFQAFDGKSEPLQTIHAPNFYAPTAKYRVAAEWVPNAKEMTYQRTNGGSTIPAHMDGYVQFSLDGKQYRLYGESLPADGKDPAMLFIVFRDTTSTTETYPASRFLYVRDGSREFPAGYKFDMAKPTKMMLDFNQAVNPVCAYNPNTHCPIAPPENRLPVAIPAGEKRYHEE
jgi:uncharacterized protein